MRTKEIDTQERTFSDSSLRRKYLGVLHHFVVSFASMFAIIMYRQLLCSKGRREWQIIIAFHLQKSPCNEHKGRYELTSPFVKGKKDWEKVAITELHRAVPNYDLWNILQLIDVCRNLAVFYRSCYKPKMNSFKSSPILPGKLLLEKTRSAVNCNKCCSLLNNKAFWAFNLFINNYYGIKSV